MKYQEFTCIICPNSCQIKIWYSATGIKDITGCLCDKGPDYVQEEFFHPVRILSTTIKVSGGDLPLVSVRTSKPIPKRMLMKAMRVVNKREISSPVKIGEVLVENILGCGVDIIATTSLSVRS